VLPDPPAANERCRIVARTLSRVGDKWSVLVVMLLGPGPRRFSELQRAMDGISKRMLTLALRGLERDGLVSRTVTPATPPRVDYALTELGHSLRGPIDALAGWAVANERRVDAARDAFDARVKEPPAPSE